MKLSYAIKAASKSLYVHRGRSFLTILGIVIGILSIILIMSIGRGAENLILDEVSGLGADTIVIRPGREPKGPADITDTLFADSITERDLQALKKPSNVPGLKSIAPAIIVSGNVSYRGNTYRPQVWGWSSSFFSETFNVFPSKGRNFGELDEKSRAHVAVIGHEVVEELFEGKEALGETIKIKDRNFKVVGIYPKKGQVAFTNLDDLILIPYTTAQKNVLGIDHFHELMVVAKDESVVDQTVLDIETTLREMHDIDDPEKDDFFVTTSQAAIEQISNITRSLTVFLSSVVAVALVVGGIGVMNIMLVSVTERTREIGLRKAVGATESEISNQFMLEAMILTIAGGVIGIILGGLLAYAVSWGLTAFLFSSWRFTMPISAIVLGVGVSALVGLVFGLYPARQAAKKSPIEALRYE